MELDGARAIAEWHRWANSPEGIKARDALTLGQSSEASIYLTNRLQVAFLSGLSLGLEIASAHILSAMKAGNIGGGRVQ